MEVRFFKKSERQLLLDSIDRLWRHDHIYVRNPAVLEHLVLNTPYRAEFAGEDNYSFVGMWDDDGKVIGLQGIIPQRFNVFGEECCSSTGTVWYVDKTSRSKLNKPIDGLKMSEFAYSSKRKLFHRGGPSAGCSFGLSEISYQISEAYGAYMTRDLPRWIGIVDKDSVMKYLLPESTPPIILPEVHPIDYNEALKVRVDEFEQTGWDAFYHKVVAPKTIGTQRDYRFLKWRYIDSPVLKYRFVTVHNDADKYVGLAIFRREPIFGGKFSLGRIVEFICFQAEASIVLASAMLKTYPDVIAWDFYCLSGITAFGLEAVGFRRIPIWMDQVMMPTRFQPVDYEHMKINGQVSLSDNIRRKVEQMTEIPWYITRGDSDQDRAN